MGKFIPLQGLAAAHYNWAVDTLFGVERPTAPCEARIEIKLPGINGLAGPGRPIKIWSGPSDTDEALVHSVICKNEVLNGLTRTRNLLEAGYCVLSGRLTFYDAAQEIAKRDIEVMFIPLGKNEKRDDFAELFQRLYETYTKTMVELKQSHDASVAKLAEHFSLGLGKVSEGAAAVSSIAEKIHEDRMNLNSALLAHLKGSVAPQKTESFVDQILKFGSLAQGLGDLMQKTPLGTNPMKSLPSSANGSHSDKNKGGL